MSEEMLLRVISGRVILKEKGRPQRLVEIGGSETDSGDIIDKLLSLSGTDSGHAIGDAVRDIEWQERIRMKERLDDNPQLVEVLSKRFGVSDTELKKAIHGLLRRSKS